MLRKTTETEKAVSDCHVKGIETMMRVKFTVKVGVYVLMFSHLWHLQIVLEKAHKESMYPAQPKGLGRDTSDIQQVGMVLKPQDKNRTDQ